MATTCFGSLFIVLYHVLFFSVSYLYNANLNLFVMCISLFLCPSVSRSAYHSLCLSVVLPLGRFVALSLCLTIFQPLVSVFDCFFVFLRISFLYISATLTLCIFLTLFLFYLSRQPVIFPFFLSFFLFFSLLLFFSLTKILILFKCICFNQPSITISKVISSFFSLRC
jgi:hypothetical protein